MENIINEIQEQKAHYDSLSLGERALEGRIGLIDDAIWIWLTRLDSIDEYNDETQEFFAHGL